MKPASLEMLNILKSRQFYVVDCYTVTLVIGGTVYRWTGGDADVTVNGLTYTAGKATGPYWDRSDNKAKLTWGVGTQAQTLIIDVIPGSAKIGTTPFLQAIRNGVFEQATFQMDRIFMPTYGDTRAGPLLMFKGRVAEVDAGRSLATFTLNSFLETANLQLPRNIIQPSCMNSLGDASCLATIPVQHCVVSNAQPSTTSTIITSSPDPASSNAGVFNFGKAVFTSGANNGIQIGVKTVSGAGPLLVTLVGFLPSVPAAGDTFDLSFGCDKTLTSPNGCSKFANQAHFRGFPYVPQPTVAA